MEVEVKIRLADAAAHQKVAALLAASHQVTYLQENVFFDGAAQQLSSARMVLRLRFYNGDQRCVVTLKGKAVIIDGISRGSEWRGLFTSRSYLPRGSLSRYLMQNVGQYYRARANLAQLLVSHHMLGVALAIALDHTGNHSPQVEEDIDVAVARSCVADTSQLVVSGCNLLQQIIREYKCESFVCLGGFRNVRNVYDWEGVKLELDETHYAFGTTYEIECETTHPERFRQLLSELLDKNGISYRYSSISKFGIFRAGKIGALD